MQKQNIEHILLLGLATIGGIETLFVRMASELSRQGRRVTALCPAGPIVQNLPPEINYIEADVNVILNVLITNYTPAKDTTHVCIWASYPFLLNTSYKLQKLIYRKWHINSNSISGIFIPPQLSNTSKFSLLRMLALLLLIPPGGIYFMSDVIRRSFVDRYGRMFENWPVHKLSLSEACIRWKSFPGNTLTVVSVGRLVTFKAYNFGATDIVKALEQKGIACIWHIWGDGEDLENAKAYARQQQVSDKVIFHGTLDYAKLEQEVCKYDIFVGMGTAALEAAQCGMPTIIALVNSRHQSYGYLYENPDDSIGEIVNGLETKTIVDMLADYYDFPIEQRQEIGNHCRVSVSSRVQSDGSELGEELMKGVPYPPTASISVRTASISIRMAIICSWLNIMGLLREVKLFLVGS